MEIPFALLASLASEAGLELVGVAANHVPDADKQHLRLWQESGYAGQMHYMLRDPDLLGDAKRLLPTARSVLSFAVPYSTLPHPPLVPGFGRVARYAWGKDYHVIIPQRLEALSELIRQSVPTLQCRWFTDAVPMLERAYARIAGVGFIGKNSMLIRPRLGSFMFLAELVLNIGVSKLPPPLFNEAGCGSCSRCIEQCPTGAIVADRRVDARRCISYLTIEHKGAFSQNEPSMLGEWLFGCDICQEVCPFNHTTIYRNPNLGLEEFSASQGVGPLLSIEEVLDLRTNRAFRKRFEGSPLLRAKREGLLRNACCVAVNTEADFLMPALKVTAQEDSSNLVRTFANWAHSCLSGNHTPCPDIETLSLSQQASPKLNGLVI